MSRALQGYRRTRGGAPFPLVELRDHIRAHGPPDAEALSELSRRIGLPVATLRGAIGFYADLHEANDAVRVCRGTSCTLARGGEESEQDDPHTRVAYCLGYCDRSPAHLTGDGEVVARGERGPDMPDIRAACSMPIITARISEGDHADLSAAREAGTYDALARAVAGDSEVVLRAIEDSGERGRGGAAYPTGVKWRTCAEAPGATKYVIANGDEGDPGSFIDRVLMEHDPHAVLEGMALCGFAVGATRGIVFVRSEYPAAIRVMENAIEQARAAGILGANVFGSDVAFHVDVFPALGSYVCGEETAMLNAIEGLRGEVRLRPPYPAEAGLYGEPTVVDNVETLANVPWIVRHGAERYAALGTEASSGTKAFCLNHGFARPGIVEVEYGTPLRRVIEEHGGGAADGAELEAVILGGPMGSIVFPDQWDVPVCYDAMAAANIELGHAGMVALPKGTDWHALLVHWLRFMQEESCGKCVPCRLGSKQALQVAQNGADAATLSTLFELMEDGSLCAFGKLMPGPMRTLLERVKDTPR